MHPEMYADTPFEIQKETAPTETHMHDTDGVSSRLRIKKFHPAVQQGGIGAD